MSDFRVRQATRADAAIIASLLDGVIRFHGRTPPRQDQLMLAAEQVLGAWTESKLYLVAEGGDRQPIGMVQVLFQFSTWDVATYAYLEDFFVVEDWRGRGVGSALLERAMREASQRRCFEVRLDVALNNEPARAFYRRHNFQEEGFDLWHLPLT